MTIEKILTQKAFDLEDKKCDICHIPDTETLVVNLEDAINICKEALRHQKVLDSALIIRLNANSLPAIDIALAVVGNSEPEDL